MRLFNLVRSPLALIYFGEEQEKREGGTPSLLNNFTTNYSHPHADTARSLHLRSRRTQRAPLQEVFDLFALPYASAADPGALPAAHRGAAEPRMGSRWRQDSGNGWGWHAGAPHLGGRQGRRASRLRGAGPGRRGGRTVMSEEQVSRCHTHSGVAESTMCVSQWLTCSWRVTGGRRSPPAA